MNYRFELEEWLPKCPLNPKDKEYSGSHVTGPSQLCNNELLRRGMQDQYNWGPPIPMDVFVMADGEPADRHVTKIGGLPYRPASAKWPKMPDGEPMTFIAQFNFCDSKDITGDLPGDVLLVFAEYSEEMTDSVCFEWQPLGLSKLISADDVPESSGMLAPCYGHILRTMSYPHAQRIVPREKQECPKFRRKDVWDDFHLLTFQATQIGRAPFFIQGSPQLPGRMLCTISSVQTDHRAPFPWVNHPEPLAADEWNSDSSYLMIGDMGCIYISIDNQQRLHSSESCF